MIIQKIYLERYDWNVVIYYNISTKEEVKTFINYLKQHNCPARDVNRISKLIPRKKDIGVSYSVLDTNLSIIGIGHFSSCDEVLNTIIHEFDHVQNAICRKYGIDISGEEAAYIIGHLAGDVYKLIKLCNLE